jgi:alpha-beta hydrolase superfamily lysophospholipase
MVRTLFHVRKYFPTPLQDELFTTDPEGLNFMAQDELGLRQVTANLYKMGEFLNTGNLMTPRLQRLTMPVLVLLSKQDRILDVPAVIAGLYNRLETKKKLVTYDQVEHFLLFEDAVRQDVLDDITHWIDTFDYNP